MGAAPPPAPGFAPAPGMMAPPGYGGMAPPGAPFGMGPTGGVGEMRDPMKMMILTLVTCGIWNIILIYFKVLPELKAYLNKSDQELNPTKELIMALICGVFQFLTILKIGKLIQEAQRKAGRQNAQDNGVNFLIFGFLFFPLAAMKVQQEMNKIWDPSLQ